MNTNKSDVAAIIFKGSFRALPVVGPLLAEIVGTIIPNQMIDRIESTLRLLESKILEQDQEKVKQRIVNPEYVDLIEDGFWQAARALSEERKDYIASLLKNGLTDDELKHIEYNRLMSILGELNDIEILILKSELIGQRQPEYKEFWEMHGHLLRLPALTSRNATQERVDKQAIHKTHKLHLTSLGLLKRRFKTLRKGDPPEFDQETGMIKATGYDITMLGKLLLRSIDQAAPESGA
jgi:hypothetical protein